MNKQMNKPVIIFAMDDDELSDGAIYAAVSQRGMSPTEKLDLLDHAIQGAPSIDLYDRIDELEQALGKIVSWSEAYPLQTFPEPALNKARALLEAGGISLASIIADATRHVVIGVGRIARKALKEPKQ
jgi:hypothetical protein